MILAWFLAGLALRFGGRTYPGIYFPDDAFLNGVFNGATLFTKIGYDAVAIGFVASLALVLTRLHPRIRMILKVVVTLAIATAVAIAIYGFYWAVVLDRSA